MDMPRNVPSKWFRSPSNTGTTALRNLKNFVLTLKMKMLKPDQISYGPRNKETRFAVFPRASSALENLENLEFSANFVSPGENLEILGVKF